MKTKQLLLLIPYVLLVVSCKHKHEVSIPDIDWKHQVDSLLMPFWMTPEAQGQPIGNFPTYRASDGSIMTKHNIDFNELNDIDNFLFVGGTDSLQREFLRMKSRQVYAYGVGFHLTGNKEYLKLAKKGIEYLFKHGEYETGFPVSFWKDGVAMPSKNQRNAQDLAYALTGPSFYYYLTRDEEVLESILKVKKSIFKEYYKSMPNDSLRNHFIWVKENFEYDTIDRIELVAQLDQLNAYMLLLTPILPDIEKNQFKNEMKSICYLLKDKFYNEEYNLFKGNLSVDIFDSSHSDFGHSIKTLWMMLKVGQLIKDHTLIEFAKSKGLELLETAFVKKNGSWAWKYLDKSGKRDEGNLWWVYTELDQMAATLSLKDTTLYSTYLKRTYDYWEDKFIDEKHKETWLALYDNGKPVTTIGKAGIYKNAYHSLEHALVGYLSTANYYKNDIILYYAFKKGKKPENRIINPYYFNAEINEVKEYAFKDSLLDDLKCFKLSFNNIE